MSSSDRQTPAKVVGFWIFKMEKMYGALFSVLEVPNLKIKKPTWFHQPSAMTVFAVVLLSYFMVTGGRRSFLLQVYVKLNIFHN